MRVIRLIPVLASIVAAGPALSLELAQPDDALVRRLEQHPEEYAARASDCARLSVAQAVSSPVCVSVQEVRYRRERSALRVSHPAVVATAATVPATPAVATSTRR